MGFDNLYDYVVYANYIPKKIWTKNNWNKKASNPIWLLWGFILGCGICFLLFVIYRLLYGIEFSNAFVYLGKSNRPDNFRVLFFFIYVVVSMTFSPIGEELFYRGVVHENFKEHFGNTKASIVDSSAFAITHLAHFGIVYANGRWEFLFVPSMVWVISMFLLCLVFNVVKRKSGSILGAILSHAGINLSMGFMIFFFL